MKKHLIVLLVTALCFGITTSEAYVIGNVGIEVFSSSPTGSMRMYGENWKNYYLDYDLKINGSSLFEAFCVEHQGVSKKSEQYTLLTIDDSLALFGLNPASYKAAAWIADNYYNRPEQEKWKAAAQVAIWEVVFDDLNINLDAGNLIAGAYKTEAGEILSKLPTSLPNFTSRWVLAVNPTVGEGGTVRREGFQNYLVPVPEAATMLLLGFGLLGIVIFRRQKIIR